MRNSLSEVGPWKGYGVVWASYEGSTGKRTIGKCEKCGEKCGHDFTTWSTADEKPKSTRTTYTVSTNKFEYGGGIDSVVVQGIPDEATARLIAAAPDLTELLEAISNANPMYYDDYVEVCHYCGATPDEFPGQKKFVPHDQGCLWRRVKEALAEAAKPLHVWGSYDDAPEDRASWEEAGHA